MRPGEVPRRRGRSEAEEDVHEGRCLSGAGLVGTPVAASSFPSNSGEMQPRATATVPASSGTLNWTWGPTRRGD